MKESGFVEVDGGRLFYVRDGVGPAVVLAHGAPTLDHRMWDAQVDAISRRCTFIRYDLRGYGRSSQPGVESYRHCDDLAALIRGLGFDSAVIGGMSFGAAVAIDTALANRDMVSGLILVAVAPLNGWTWVEGFPLAPALELAGTADTETVVEAILALPINDVARERPNVMSELRAMATSYSGWHFSHRDPGVWAEPRAIDRLGEIDVPTLVVMGGRDVLDVRMICGRVATTMPTAVLRVIDTVGHNPNMEDPAAFDRWTLEFLDDVLD